MTEYYFITDSFKDEIRHNVIDNVFPNLNGYQQNLLFEYLVNIIDVLAIKFNFDLEYSEKYYYQFRQNNYRDGIGLLFLLLPFIDDVYGDKRNELKSLDELYIRKNPTVYQISMKICHYIIIQILNMVDVKEQ